jgi:cold shock CspA family protein
LSAANASAQPTSNSAADSGITEQTTQGIVARFFEAKKFGFITPDGSRSSDIFFHISVWPAGSTPKVDMAVEFVTEMDPKSGRLRASSVRPI